MFNYLKSLNISWSSSEKLIQELAWRDYWQLAWNTKGDTIFRDLKHVQNPVSNYQISRAVVSANTGIIEIDHAIERLFETGYMHNHMRMYVASLCCNLAQSHWLKPSQWLYYHLLDGDLASNSLSWQWVAGTNANKKYYANQDNINKYFYSNQQNTFLDVSYENILNLDVPKVLTETTRLELHTSLPQIEHPSLKSNQKTLIYNYYNLDPFWRKDEDAQRILLLEPRLFDAYPVSNPCIEFVINLSKNISGIKIMVGSFEELLERVDDHNIFYKEHPTNAHYKGNKDPRDWMTKETTSYQSFFAFWKHAKKELKSKWQE
ncbi:FAD-binding domain-containing protein [Hanstruepera ponticola]|uniref:FAD-binding domain-containing protein n=1 Tax=Hanstruepera ponticola TaxID=2042995 RepID=UPI001E5AADA5|nr:FAD-binding domain-containing protein [Hanstruepera ponticola]